MSAKSKSAASRKTAASSKKSPGKKSKSAAPIPKPIRKKLKAAKAAFHPESLEREAVEWVRTNPSREVLHAAIEKFGISYDHLKGWLKKEGVQVVEAVESLIASKKKTALEKGEEKLRELLKSIEEKKEELKKLSEQLKGAAQKA